MLRTRLSERLNKAIKARQKRRVSTLRLILAAIKDRDVASRGDGRGETVDDEEILSLLHKMIKQRRESIGHFEVGGRLELAEQEQDEIDIILEFLPEQMSHEDVVAAATAVVEEVEAKGLKDMGRTMATLKERFAGRMDFSAAAGVVKQLLAG